MDIRFLRPELEKLDAKLQALATMRGARVSADAFYWELWYAQIAGEPNQDFVSNYVGAKSEVHPDLVLPYLAKVTPPPASVLYIAGRNATGILPLAEAGYDVTVLMPAALGLDLLHEAAKAAGVAEKLSYACGYPADAAVFGENAFDAVVALQWIRMEKNLPSLLPVLLRACRKAICFDVMSRYGFLAARMPGGYQWTAGFTPETMLHVLDKHETPGGRPVRHEEFPLYTSAEIAEIARQAGIQFEEVIPADYREVFRWWDDPDEGATERLVRRMEGDEVLRELALTFVILGQKPAAHAAELHTSVRDAHAMAGTEVSAGAFAYEREYAASGDDMFAGEPLYLDILLPYLAEHAPPPATVLDVGAGTGRLSIPVAKAGYEVTMLEPAAAGLRLAQEKARAAGVAERMSYVCGYATDMAAFGEGAFDIAVALQSLNYEDQPAMVASLRRVSRKVVCFDVFSRYGFLVGRMPHGHAYKAGYTPTSILYVLDEHRTPGEQNPDTPENLPLYTSGEAAQLAREAGLHVDEVRPVSSQGVFEWEGGEDRAVVTELERRMAADKVLQELGGCHLVLARKPSQ
jgi:SAM-dependent methyltransferase